MYSFLVLGSKVDAALKDESHYDFFVFQGAKPIEVQYRGKPIQVKRGQRFGVRPSSNKKQIRMVLGDDISRVITLTLEQARALARGIK